MYKPAQLTPEEEKELDNLEQEFEALGGRSVLIANRIDVLRKKAEWQGELGCPDCASTNLSTIEQVMGNAPCRIYQSRDGGDIEYLHDEETIMDWDTSTTMGLECLDCHWAVYDTHVDNQGSLVDALAPPYQTLERLNS